MLFFIPTYAIISGIWAGYISKIYTSFRYFVFWPGTLFISYSITNPNYSPPIELLFILTAYMAAYAVFYGMTFTISYYLQKRNSGEDNKAVNDIKIDLFHNFSFFLYKGRN